MKKLSLIILILYMFLACVGCNATSNEQSQSSSQILAKATIDIIDVGDGECSLIVFPDGKTMMIDCGRRDEKVYLKIEKVLEARKVSKIDYFILTHPDAEHIGNAEKVLENYGVGVLYHSDVIPKQMELFTSLNSAILLAEQKGVQIKNSKCFERVIGEGYTVLFLSPKQTYHLEVGAHLIPSEELIDDFSPIIYVEILEKRIIFTGDAGIYSEEVVLSNYKSGLYNSFLSGTGRTVALEKIDFLKLSRGGGSGAGSQEFFNILRPSTAFISVGGNDKHGAPSSDVIERLILANDKVDLHRTDLDGNITVKIDKESNMMILTESDLYV